MRTLLLDIETAPNRAFVWGLWDQNIALEQVMETSFILCWTAKWLGQHRVYFRSSQRSSKKHVLGDMHRLLDRADVVVHYNGIKFDIPTLNKEFIKLGLAPPSPYKQLDLMRVVRRAFRFESNKLDHVCDVLGIGKKLKHKGFKLWVDCMDGVQSAWRMMERYNRRDVRLLEKLYYRLRPWITNHPNLVESTGLQCPKCKSDHVQRRGTAVAMTRRYNRYHCQGCGGWFRGTTVKVMSKEERGVNL